MTLAEQINKKRREIKTDGYPMSIGEWLSMYEGDELDIHPDFQRFFRWTDAQKSALIESILLGIPLPAVFVSQREDGVWDVVDGLQRLSTIFQFVGVLRNEKGKIVKPLKLKGTKYLPALEGTTWGSNDSGNKNNALPKDLQLIIKRSKISASIVLKESDSSAKYDLFQRLNTGGSVLSPQEVRNCLLVMINKPLFTWLNKLKNNEKFVTTISLSDRAKEESYDTELALRFVLLSLVNESDIVSVGDIGVYLTDEITKTAQNKKFKKRTYAKLFESTFNILDEILSDDSFRRFDKNKNKHEGGFKLSLFEVLALGVAYNIHNDTLCEKNEIVDRAREITENDVFKKWAVSGMTAARRLPHLLPLGRNVFSK